MARYEVRIAEGEDRTRVEVIEAGGFHGDKMGALVFYDDRGIPTRAFAVGCWQEVRKIESAARDPKDVVEGPAAASDNADYAAVVELKTKVEATVKVCRQHFWTKDLPQVPGYYWVDRDGSVSPHTFIPPQIVRVERWPGALGFCYRIEGCRDFHDVGEPGLQWCGPIPKPMEAPPARPPKPDSPPNHGSVTGRTGVDAVPPPPPEPNWI